MRKEVPNMMNVYSGFDSLNDKEYDELMQEMAENNADDYFEHELENDAVTQELAQEVASPEFQAELAARYQLIVLWDDISSKSESSNEITAVLNAATIYMMDASCISVAIYDWKEHKNVLDWNR